MSDTERGDERNAFRDEFHDFLQQADADHDTGALFKRSHDEELGELAFELWGEPRFPNVDVNAIDPDQDNQSEGGI